MIEQLGQFAGQLHFKVDGRVAEIIDRYPPVAQRHLFNLRSLIVEVATDAPDIAELTETLKWGEPSYLTKGGLTLRMDWKAKQPDRFALYCSCTSKLIATIKAIYGQLFDYEGSRALLFPIGTPPPVRELRSCILLALTYHRRKHLPLLGVKEPG